MLLASSSLVAAEYNDKDSYVSFSWQSTDIVCAYTTDASRIKLFVKNVSADAHNATLTGYGWGLAFNTQYYGYAPYNTEYHSKSLPMTSLPISYMGQAQQGNASTAHLAAFDYMTTQTVSTSSACNLPYNHLGSIVRIECPMKSSETLASVSLSSGSDVFTIKANMNVTNNAVTATEKTDKLSLSLGEMQMTQGQTMVAYMMMSPVDLSSTSVDVTITTTDGKVATQTFSAPKMKPGKLYTIKMDAEFADIKDDDKPSGGEVLAKGNTVFNHPEEKDNPAESNSIVYPTASASDFALDTESNFKDNVLLGDANGDGKVNTTDAVVVINYYLGKTNKIEKRAADINKDGKINTTDAVGIINKYLGR